jgi:protein-disulfide isomerase
VLASPWAYWLGIPVSLPGLGFYAVFLISTFSLKSDQLEKAKRALNTLTLCSFAIIGAAIWFVGVQAIAIRAFCPYCCTAHASASLAAIILLYNANGISSRLAVRPNLTRSIGAAAGLIALIAGVQLVAPTRQSPKIVDVTGSKPAKSAETDPNLFPIPLRLQVDRLPMIGSMDTPHRIGLLFDYTCHHCRDMHSYIREAVETFDGQLACVLIPVPLDANCNKLIEETHEDHVDACKYAKLCLAVHLAAPEKYDAFDRWLFSNHKQVKKLEEVRQHAEKLIGADSLEKALSSAAVREQLQQNIRAYDGESMPQTIIEDAIMYGPASSGDEVKAKLKELLNLK